MKSFIIKITEHLQNETTQDGLRNIFRDILTGTTLMSVLAASAAWLLKEFNMLAWLTLPLTLLLLFLIFFGDTTLFRQPSIKSCHQKVK